MGAGGSTDSARASPRRVNSASPRSSPPPTQPSIQRRRVSQAPPEAAVSAAETRGDCTAFYSHAGVHIVLCLCKWRRLELFVDGSWTCFLESLQAEEINDKVVISEEGKKFAQLPYHGAEMTIFRIIQLCDRALVPHDLLELRCIDRPEFRCPDCGCYKAIGPSTCSISGRPHNDLRSSGFGPSGVMNVNPSVSAAVSDLWTQATILPPGAAQSTSPVVSEPPSPVRSPRAERWECPACLYLNSAVMGKSCRVCGAERPLPDARSETPASLIQQVSPGDCSLPVTPASRQSKHECPMCRRPLACAPPFCPMTGRPHPPASPRNSPRSPRNREKQLSALRRATAQNNAERMKEELPASRNSSAEKNNEKPILPPSQDLTTNQPIVSLLGDDGPPAPNPKTATSQTLRVKRHLPATPGMENILPGSIPDFSERSIEKLKEAKDDGNAEEYDDDLFPTYEEGEEGEEEEAEEDELVEDVECGTSLRECLMCRNNKKNTVLMPCRHLSICNRCAPGIVACPQCGVMVSHRLEVWV
eukprot:Sspe_Gene.46765::Locus_23467_Transcript_1_1_Confidence_1.000_Length_1878::g.46765::m.46765